MEVEQRMRRIAVVTGASRRRGIGSAICRALGQANLDIFFTHWGAYDKKMPWGAEEDEPVQLQQYLHKLGVRCEHMQVDLSQPDAPASIIDTVEQKLVVCSASIDGLAMILYGLCEPIQKPI